MSLFDRDYFYRRTNPGWGRSPYDEGGALRPGLTDVVRGLVAVNVAVFLIAALLSKAGVPFFRHVGKVQEIRGMRVWVTEASDFEKWFGLFSPYLVGRGFIWQFVTYQFLHGGLLHLFFNMFTLYMLGSALERQIGSLAFLRLYLLGGVFAGFVNLVPHIFVEYPTIGASGAVCAVVAAYGLLNPHTRLVLFVWFFPVVLKARTLVIMYAVWTALQALGADDGIAHLAHLGGLVFGWMYVYNVAGVRWLIDGGKKSIGTGHRQFDPRHWWEAVWRAARGRGVYRGEEYEDAEYREKAWDVGTERMWDPRIDEILDKMAREGFHTLTDEEWEILQRYRKQE